MSYKGYTLQPTGDRSRELVAPNGAPIASFTSYWGEEVDIEPLVDGLDCRKKHNGVYEAVRDLADQHERLTTTTAQRLWRVFLSHGGWGALAAVIAAIAGIIAAVLSWLTYLKPPGP